MGKHKSSVAYGVRLPNEMWEAINAEASSLGMSRNEWLSRKLTTALRAARESSETAKSDSIADEEAVVLP